MAGSQYQLGCLQVSEPLPACGVEFFEWCAMRVALRSAQVDHLNRMDSPLIQDHNPLKKRKDAVAAAAAVVFPSFFVLWSFALSFFCLHDFAACRCFFLSFPSLPRRSMTQRLFLSLPIYTHLKIGKDGGRGPFDADKGGGSPMR